MRYSYRPPFFRIFKNVFSSSCCGTTQINIESPPSSPVSIASAVEEQGEKKELHFVAQSGDLVKDDSDEVQIQQQTVEFLDEQKGTIAGFRYVDGLMHSDTTTDVELKNFLERPVRIYTHTWAETDVPGDLGTINPWQLFFSNSYVQNKIANFAFIRCNLKVKVMINASPFYYGALLCSYHPLPNLTPTTITNGANLNWFVPLSQRPHLWIYPGNSEGGEMTLPFFYHKNWISVQTNQDFVDMGSMRFTAFTQLQNANGVTGQGVTIQVYAWAEDVELSGPSVGLTMQTGDEYGDGPISKPASAVAEAASRLSDVPLIGRFATATQIGAGALSRMATLFGYSNPPVLDNTKPFRSNPFPQMANASVCFPAEKLALDPKNELSVDPSVVGLPSVDELEISRLVQRESYIDDTAWACADSADKILFSANVTPMMWANETFGSAGNLAFGTPTAFVGRMFNNWRGDIIFRFKFVATQFHKGRVRISWDPRGTSGSNLISTADTANIVQTKIVDLGKDTDVEFRIPYHQAFPWLRINHDFIQPWSTSSTPTWSADPLQHNGVITIRVLTALTAPVGTSVVPILVFMRGASNLEYANPGMGYDSASQFVCQSGDVLASVGGDESQQLTMGEYHGVPKERYLVNFGEKVTTLRSLLYRHSLVRTDQVPPSSNAKQSVTYDFHKFPLAWGYDPNGVDQAKGIITSGNSFPFNWVHPNFLSWIISAFVGVRGSMVWSVNVTSVSNTGLQMIRVMRRPDISVVNRTVTTHSDVYTSVNQTNYIKSIFLRAGTGGSAITNQGTQNGLSFICPQYSMSKFDTPSVQYRALASTATIADFDSYRLELSMQSSGSSNQNTDTEVHWFCAGGADLTPLFFLNVPVLNAYPSAPHT